MRNIQQSRKAILLSLILVFACSTNIFASEDCPKKNLKARLAYNSGVFWSGRGDNQKAFDLFSEALEICPDYSAAIAKQNEVGLILEKQREKIRIEKERRFQAQKESELLQIYQKQVRKERQREIEARKREQLEQEANPNCTKGENWEFVINNAYRASEENAINRNYNSTFIRSHRTKYFTFTKQHNGKFKGQYLLEITNVHGSKTSKSFLLPMFDVNQPSDHLNDESTLWKIVRATLNGVPY